MTTERQPRDRAGRFEETPQSPPEIALSIGHSRYAGPTDRRAYGIYAQAANARGAGIFAAFAEASMHFDWTAALAPSDP